MSSVRILNFFLWVLHEVDRVENICNLINVSPDISAFGANFFSRHYSVMVNFKESNLATCLVFCCKVCRKYIVSILLHSGDNEIARFVSYFHCNFLGDLFIFFISFIMLLSHVFSLIANFHTFISSFLIH